jgi:hypothetical protein
MHASQAALRNSQKEKLTALRNAVLNAALPNPPEESIQQMFVNFIDSLTVWHRKFNCEVQHLGEQEGICYPKWPCQKPMFNLPKLSESS